MESRKYRECPENGFLMKMLAGWTCWNIPPAASALLVSGPIKVPHWLCFIVFIFFSPFYLKPIIPWLLGLGLVASCETSSVPRPLKMTDGLLLLLCFCRFQNVLFLTLPSSRFHLVFKAELTYHFVGRKLSLLPLSLCSRSVTSCLCVPCCNGLWIGCWCLEEDLGSHRSCWSLGTVYLL